MNIIRHISSLRAALAPTRANNTIGFVPTMGALHKGHISLIEAAKKECDIVVVSIFVNPTQFGPNEDFNEYPRVFEIDAARCEAAGVDYIFHPEHNEIYPDQYQTSISLKEIPQMLCGNNRPGHFDGVATVVTKLFNIVQPNRVYLGEKDYQQCVLIQQLVNDLNLDITIIPCPTIRESDGLAMSSRNNFLSPKGRKIAGKINGIMRDAIDRYHHGFTHPEELSKLINDRFIANGILPEYIVWRNSNSLDLETVLTKKSRLFIAAMVEHVRLIDNIGMNNKLNNY